VAGALLAGILFAQRFPAEAHQLAGTLTGTYVGGSLNFAAVGRAVGLPDDLFVAASAADNILTAAWIGVTLLFPRPTRRPAAAVPETTGDDPKGPWGAGSPLSLGDLAWLLALGLALVLAAERTAQLTPGVPSILWLTTFALAVAQLPPVRRLAGSFELGMLALHAFFVLIGIGSRVAEILTVGLAVFWFTLLVVAVHGMVTFAAARLARLDGDTTAVASQAAVGGPSTALALASARGRPDLLAPGAIAGLLGYALGNYLGLGVAYLLG
jgi:uncharacterized membrane protein